MKTQEKNPEEIADFVVNCLQGENKTEVFDLKKEEKKFMKEHKDDVYEFFGYCFDLVHESSPFFYKTDFIGDGEWCDEDKCVYPFSPKTLEFCVKKLSLERRLMEVGDYKKRKDFRTKCLDIAYFNSFSDPKVSEQEWFNTINRIFGELNEFSANYWYDYFHKKEAKPEEVKPEEAQPEL